MRTLLAEIAKERILDPLMVCSMAGSLCEVAEEQTKSWESLIHEMSLIVLHKCARSVGHLKSVNYDPLHPVLTLMVDSIGRFALGTQTGSSWGEMIEGGST